MKAQTRDSCSRLIPRLLWRSIKLHSSALSLRSWLEVNLIYKCGAPCVSANPVVSGALQIGLDGSIIRHLLSKSQSLFCRIGE
jgi:hypothetical protein